MRIDKLQVHNFRGFSDTEIVLNGKDAIFYGVNGMGNRQYWMSAIFSFQNYAGSSTG